jgi:hypothetical protein
MGIFALSIASRGAHFRANIAHGFRMILDCLETTRLFQSFFSTPLHSTPLLSTHWEPLILRARVVGYSYQV